MQFFKTACLEDIGHVIIFSVFIYSTYYKALFLLQMDPYDYEKIEFVLRTLEGIRSEPWANKVKFTLNINFLLFIDYIL